MKELILNPNREPDLSKIVDQDILDTFKDTSVFYGDIISAQLIRTMQELLIEMRQKSEFPPKKSSITFKDPRECLNPLSGEEISYQETID